MLISENGHATISVDVTEPATGNGYLMAWLDWDGNGQFDADEVISDDLQDTDGDGDINLSVSVPAAFTLRVRSRDHLGMLLPRHSASTDIHPTPKATRRWHLTY